MWFAGETQDLFEMSLLNLVLTMGILPIPKVLISTGVKLA
jgi:hypothetical protein